MEEKPLDENCNREDEKEEEEQETPLEDDVLHLTDPEFMCGYGRYRPKFLQVFNNPKWFIVFLSIFSCCQGLLVNGLTSLVIPELEKEFGFSSKESGVILASNDASGIILVGIVSYFGSNGHKPKWIGYGSIITGLGSLLFALPKVLIGKYSPAHFQINPTDRGLCLAGTNLTHIHRACAESNVASSGLNLMVFSIAQLIFGAGTAPLYTLGPAFLDENVHPKMSPIYIGIWFATTFLGPGLGYALGGLFLKQYTDITVPPGLNLTPGDPRWVGAWWIGYFSLSFVLFLAGIFLLGYPRKLLKSRQKREEALKKGDLLTADETLGSGFRAILPSLFQLLTNKPYIFAVIGLTVKTIYGISIGSFFAKLLKSKFNPPSYIVGIAVGVILIPGAAGGILSGAYIMKKINVRESAKKGTLLCTVFGCIAVGFSTCWLIPGCKDAEIRGISTPYLNESSASGLINSCNSKCGCAQKIFSPVCGSDSATYFSSCHAGCQNRRDLKVFTNCSCVTPRPVNNATAQFVTMGFCDRDCKNLSLFLGCSIFIILIAFISATPHKMVILRSVPDNQRSFALGIQFLFMRGLSFIPGPVIMGSIIDNNCLVWTKDACGNTLNCAAYNLETLSGQLVIFGCATSFISSICYFLSYWFSKTTVESKDQNHPSQKELLREDIMNEDTKVPSIQKLSAV